MNNKTAFKSFIRNPLNWEFVLEYVSLRLGARKLSGFDSLQILENSFGHRPSQLVG